MQLDDSYHSFGCCRNPMNRTYISSVCPPDNCHNPSILEALKRNNSSSSSRRQPSRVDSICTEGSSNSSPSGVRKLKKIQTIWSTIKRFSPVHRIKNSYNKRKLFETNERLYASHPDISCNNLVVLTQIETKRSRDDTDVIAITNSNRNKHSNGQTFFVQTSNAIYSFNNSNPNLNQMDPINADNELALSRQRITLLRQHPFYHLEVHLIGATNLLAKDTCGTSDPYVKFKIGNKIVYKSRTVNKCLDPKWDEHFIIPIEDVFQQVTIRAYDYDFGFQDDFLGATCIDLTKLDIQKPTALSLILTESGLESHTGSQSWGEIYLTVTLVAKTQEDKEMHFTRGIKTVNVGSGADTTVKKLKTQLWDSVVNIVLVEAKNISDDTPSSDLHFKFKLGSDKYKSKVIARTSNPVWSEQFDLHTYLDQSKMLEMSLFGREELGKCFINLNDIAAEETHKIWTNLGGGASVLILLTISATLGSETVSHLNNCDDNSKQENTIKNKYSLIKSFSDIDDIGILIVKVFRADGLAAADIGGKSDPFCVLELVNARLQTNTEYKTLSPEWNKIYSFNIKDIHSVLEITVYDEDRDKKVEFLGKVAIPLLKIKNSEKKWFGLKDKKLLVRAKGQILLEMSVHYNKIKASIRTFNPRETKFVKQEQRFKRIVFIRNVSRLKGLCMEAFEVLKFVNSCFQWDSVSRSIIAFAIFMITTYFFEIYMAPVFILILFIKSYVWIRVEHYFNPTIKDRDNEIEEIEDASDEEDDETKNEEKKSLKEKLQTVQEITTMIQNIMGEVASTGERVKNTFNFSVPFLSWLAILCLSIITIVLYYIPLRYLIMVWGINKFTKKLRSPDAINNNELMDYLSRVPDVDEKKMYREYRIEANNQLNTSDDNKKKK